MRHYVVVSGLSFALLFAVHVARIVAEGAGPLRDPAFIASTLAALAMAAWGAFTLRRKDGGAG